MKHDYMYANLIQTLKTVTTKIIQDWISFKFCSCIQVFLVLFKLVKIYFFTVLNIL